MKNLILFLITALFFVNSLLSNPLPSPYAENSELKLNFLEKVPVWMAENHVPAVGIGLIEKGKIKYVKVFGKLQKGLPAPDNSIFNVASITKTIVTMLTFKLVEIGQWNLDEPLSNYWIDPDVVNDPLHEKITTRHVLIHQTGFVNWRYEHPTKKLVFDFAPGTKYQYSGEGFEYLRHALEHKFKKPIEKLSDSLLFESLGMKDTRHSWDNTIDESRFAAWHDAEGKKYEFSYKTGVSAANNLLTTVEDYCKFGSFVINGAGLSSTLFNEMVSPQSNIQEHRAQGLGWFILQGLPNGEYAIFHAGGNPGVKTMAVFMPKSKRGVVVFTNGENGNTIYNNVIKEVFDIGERIYEYMYERPNIPKIISVSDEIIEKYTGRYQHPAGSEIIVSKNENEFTISG